MKHGFEISWQGAVGLAGAMFFSGWIASAGYFQVANHWDQANKLHVEETKTIPALKSLAGCQERRADVLAGSVIDERGIPNCPSLPTLKPHKP